MRGVVLVVNAGDVRTAALKELPDADTVRSVLRTGVSSSIIGAGVEIVLALPAVEIDPWSPTED